MQRLTLAAVVAGALAWWLTLGLTRHAWRFGLQDIPNARSSHAQVRPRGGGVAILLAALLALGVLHVLLPAGLAADRPDPPTALLTHLLPGLTAGALDRIALSAVCVLALTGLADDCRPLGLTPRLVVQAGTVATLLLTCPLPAALQGWPVTPTALLALPVLLAAMWWVNLFNFMDGTDGLAASQAIFMVFAGLLLASGSGLFGGATTGAATLPALAPTHWALLVAAATLGFFLHNRPPARIFMGDAGSMLLAATILHLVLNGPHTGHLPLSGWLLLGTLFVADATVTLLRRLLQGHRPADAHRSHLYQQWSRRAGGHAVPLAVYSLTNCGVVFPLAWWIREHPGTGPWVLSFTWLAAAALAWCLGAGRPEGRTPPPSGAEEN